ncbi:hypothetical protein BBK36DRAFT_1139284 [Trichoderma citrinoviride]|uniref:Uncharacterized protein n=1 Tax=Trichoderma citrinoviride TaxID=58853 RepID=A0A2T4BIQ3_9HYPO|nr:hypothetical protein BBK36DRAFT_1139284 [Trichoderma citrinoviride]PTB69204.1 hypothetical protein BBK36DRAFT_1139284 [Trichoderma citrinoviride]
MRGREKDKKRRPLISAPVGPVKSSRGADLIRSERLIIVDTIDDCETASSDSTLRHRSRLPTHNLRHISDSFRSDGQLHSSPTDESCDSASTPTIKAFLESKSSKKQRRSLLSTTSSIPKPSFKATLLTVSVAAQQDENIPPASEGLFHLNPPAQRVASKLPKSRTMSALHELKTSISRPSLVARSVNVSAFGGPSAKSSPSSNGTTLTPIKLSEMNMSQPSTTSLAKSVHSCTSGAPSLHISSAQSSAYWTGRFMALHDRFSSENLAVDARESRLSLADSFSVQPKTPYSNLYQRASHLPTSTTTSALRSLMTSSSTSSISEEDARARRVFDHLDSLCSTSEARRSLHIWQQAYARRHNSPYLLPEGGTMGTVETKGFMAKLFGSSKKNERHSFSKLQQCSYIHENKSKSFLSGSFSRASRGKRLTVT